LISFIPIMKPELSKKGENMIEGKFVWPENEEIFNNNAEYDTIEDALKDASSDLEKGETIYIGKIKKIDLSVDANKVIEDLQEIVYDQAGDAASDFLNDVTKDQEDVLQKMINETLIEWLEENNLIPSFFSVEEVKEYII